MTKLTLPIEIGKKYVRRDGKIATINRLYGNGWADAIGGECYCEKTGSYFKNDDNLRPGDLIADYQQPAKGHPHAEKMAEFAQDARETETPWERWEYKGVNDTIWRDYGPAMLWSTNLEYRRKPTITPDPHAASMLLYAQDAAETDKAWERWECDHGCYKWRDLDAHPRWDIEAQYRRKVEE